MSAFNKVIRSFQYALRGVREITRSQLNFRIHLVVACAVVLGGFICGLERWEWVALLICIGVVLAAEAFNTAVETLCDHLHPEVHPGIRKVKDISAAAVVILTLAAVATGLVVFLG